MVSEIRRQIGRDLRLIRHEKGMTLVEVGGRAGICHVYLSEVERGVKEPSWTVLAAICDALDLSLRVGLYAK